MYFFLSSVDWCFSLLLLVFFYFPRNVFVEVDQVVKSNDNLLRREHITLPSYTALHVEREEISA